MRISRDEMLMEIARTVAKRGTCDRKQVGAVIALNGRVISIGYNGSPPGMPHCTEVGCLIVPEHTGCQRTLHGEANAIAWAAREGKAILGAHLFVTCSPCLPCAKIIASAGIARVVYDEEYRDTSGIELLRSCSIEAVHYGT